MSEQREKAHLGLGDFLSGGKGAFDQAAGHSKTGLGFGLADHGERWCRS